MVKRCVVLLEEVGKYRSTIFNYGVIRRRIIVVSISLEYFLSRPSQYAIAVIIEAQLRNSTILVVKVGTGGTRISRLLIVVVLVLLLVLHENCD